jgi:hypothetical protein
MDDDDTVSGENACTEGTEVTNTDKKVVAANFIV